MNLDRLERRLRSEEDGQPVDLESLSPAGVEKPSSRVDDGAGAGGRAALINDDVAPKVGRGNGHRQ